jgi:presqualene diphosphate synthase
MSEAEAMDHAETVVRRSGSSFFWAMRMLPEEKRRAMFAVYAFCREVDDIADEPGEEAGKRFRLAQWRGEIERLYGGQPRFPVAVALARAVARFDLSKSDFRAVIDGMEMDAADTLRIDDMDMLNLYCDRVACAVGRLSNRVFGIDGETAERLAFSLGQALQLTNILRDLREDAERDRLYLPIDVLRAHGIDHTEPNAVLAHGAVGGVCELLAGVARNRFDEAAAMLAECDRRKVRPAVMMKEVYSRVLHRLSDRGWQPVGGRVRLSPLSKLWIVLRHGVI